MKYLFDEWNKIKTSLAEKHLVLFLDYDGTLVPIAQTPDQARLTKDAKEALIKLSKLPRNHLAIISGRKLSDLRTMVDVPNIIYIGNHGLEIEGAHLDLSSLISTQYRADLKSLKEELKTSLSGIKGAWLEDKEMILAVHFRLAAEKEASLAKTIFMNVCEDHLSQKRISILEGNKILEVRPPVKWNKGEAALWLTNKWRHQLGEDHIIPIYVGDDTTDEDAFKSLNPDAITIKVGDSPKSSAKYFLNSPNDVLAFLKKLEP